jgi:hypothetical protein
MSEFEAEEFETEVPPEADLAAVSVIEDGLDRTVASKEAARRQLEEDMRRFLGGGGAITKVDANVRADPPRKPESNYGSRPI